jgi:carotenoid cleavage dioxygenase
MEAFGIAAALATAVQVRALIVLHLLPTGYNPVRDAVSDYGVGPQQTLNDRAQEFPRVDDRVISRPHQYGYSAMIGEVSQAISPLTGDFADEAFTNALLKHDLTHGTAETHDFGQHATAGEAVFAPAAPGAAEDDGYVFAHVHNPDRGASDLVILAAQDFTAAPVARVHLPARIPLGFHRSWLADQDHGPDR